MYIICSTDMQKDVYVNKTIGKAVTLHIVAAFCTKETEILRIILCMGLLQINTVHDKIRC